MFVAMLLLLNFDAVATDYKPYHLSPQHSRNGFALLINFQLYCKVAIVV